MLQTYRRYAAALWRSWPLLVQHHEQARAAAGAFVQLAMVGPGGEAAQVEGQQVGAGGQGFVHDAAHLAAQGIKEQHLHRAAVEFSVYPNPVARHGRSTVAYEASGGPVQVVLLDALGREVRRIVDRALPAGPHLLPLDLSDLAAGAYHCQVREAQRSGSRLLVVLE